MLGAKLKQQLQTKEVEKMREYLSQNLDADNIVFLYNLAQKKGDFNQALRSKKGVIQAFF